MDKLSNKQIILIKTLIHILNLCFLAYLIIQTISGNYGADPVQAITHFTGNAALNVLMLTLLITPVAKWTKQSSLFRYRRLMDLYCFFWACLHILTFFWLNLALDFSLFTSEVVKRPYLALGAICWIILFALSITSFKRIQKKMGKNWQQLHNWVYLVLLLAPIHFYWSTKSEKIEPSIYIVFALFLLFTRRNKLLFHIRKWRR